MTFQTGISSTNFLGSLLHALCVPPSNKSAFTEQKTHRRHTEVRNTLVFVVLIQNTKISLQAIQAGICLFSLQAIQAYCEVSGNAVSSHYNLVI